MPELLQYKVGRSMKKISLKAWLCFILFWFAGCANNPVKVLNQENNLVDNGICVFLSETITDDQVVYAYYSMANTREPRFLYALHEFLKLDGSCENTENAIKFEEVYIDEIYQSAGKFNSYMRFLFDLKVGLIIDGRYYISKYYQTETTTDLITLTKDVAVSDPLSRGFENILSEVKKDIEKLKNNNAEKQ